MALSDSPLIRGLTPEQRSLRARAAAYAMHARGATNTGPATTARIAKFDQHVRDEAAARGETLTPEEVVRRAAYLRKAHMASLALKASRARTRPMADTQQ